MISGSFDQRPQSEQRIECQPEPGLRRTLLPPALRVPARWWPNVAQFGMILVLLFFHAQVMAQVPPQTVEQSNDEHTPPKLETMTSERLDQLRKQVEAAAEVDEETKKKLLDTFQKAADALTRAVKLETQTPLDQAAIDMTATKLKERQAELALPTPPLLSDVPEDASLSDLMSAHAARQPRLQEFKQKLAEREAEPNRRLERRTAIVGEQATYANRKAEIEKDLNTPAPADESAFATMARRSLLLARLREIIAEAPANQAEISKYEAEKAVDLPALRTQLARRDVARLQQEIDELNKRITAKRSQDARYIADQLAAFARGEAVPTPYDQSGTDAGLFSGALTSSEHLATAAETASLAQGNIELTGKIAKATSDVTTAQKSLENLRALKTRTNEKITRVGLTGAIGLELRRQLRTLADAGVIRQGCRNRQEEMRELEFKRLDFEDQTNEFNERVDSLQSLERPASPPSVDLRLAKDRLATLTTIGRNYGEYFNRLGELDVTEQEYIREVEEYSTFIRERVLWIRSNRWPGTDDAREVVGTVLWFFSAANWSQVRETMWADAQERIWLYLLFVLLLALLFSIQPRFRQNLSTIGVLTARSSCREFQPTVRAAVLTAVLSLAWPAIPAFLGWRLLSDTSGSPFAHAVGEGFVAVTAGFLTMNLLRQLCRPSGLGLAHFEWPAHGVKLLRARIYTLMLILLPLLFLETTLHAHENPQGRDSLERVIFVVSLIVLSRFQWVIVHPRTGIFRDYLMANSAHIAFRLRWPLYAAIVALPLTLAALAVFGYYYTAYELSWRLYVTTWVLIALVVLRSFLIRWFVVSHRKLRIEQARQRRQALVEEARSDHGTSNIPKPAGKETTVDLQEVSDQTQRFIDSGLALVCVVATWFVWVDVLPALGVFDRWELWPTTVDVTVEVTDEEGRKSFQTEPQIESVTVADAMISLVMILLTFTAARNIPGLLEMTVLQRLPLEPASRYAFRMVGRYLIVVVGLISACGAIGVGWAQVQWLAAALTVGLGFGLQEIFANFVSGLIILFERPVRIGDVVTIADVSGTVSRIQIRATTITDWDRKEYIVPNKEFVTGRLLNWTLSDRTNRVLINVGVAYGSDTSLARQLLLKVAQEHSNVLEDPMPVATFEQFGDSTLNLILRCYLPNLDNRLATITELHEAIDREFKAADIEIAFPQTDIHVRDLPQLIPAQDLPK